jgi:hypothetical protein
MQRPLLSQAPPSPCSRFCDRRPCQCSSVPAVSASPLRQGAGRACAEAYTDKDGKPQAKLVITATSVQFVGGGKADAESEPARTVYLVIGGARAGQRLSVTGQYGGWLQITISGRTGWIWGALVTPNAAARQTPQVTHLPPLPTAEVKTEVKADPTPTATST